MIKIRNDIKEILFSEEEIATRIKEMGSELSEEYREKAGDEGILMIGVLRGATIFMADLARAIDIPVEMDYMVVSSYGSATTTSGNVKIIKDVDTSLEGRHVVIAEDVIDSGLTLERLIKLLSERNPASISVVAFIRKKVPNQVEIPCRLIGFECVNEFIVGYGLDYAQRYRNLPYVGILKPEMYAD